MKKFLKCGNKDLGGCGRIFEDVGPIVEGVVIATNEVVSFLEQVITAAERVMSDTRTPLRASKWLVQVWESVG